MILEVKNIYKSFGNKEVLNDVSFATESGSALGLLGRNGAGKTTMMRIIMNFFNSDKGSVLLEGKTFHPEEHSIGYLPEERGLYPKKSIGGQLIYLGQLKGLSKQEAKANTLKLLKRLDMEQVFNKKLNTLSKGNQQKIQLAACLVNDPQIVILDEPFSGLDPVNAMLLKDIVKELVKENKIVIFSSHQMNYVEEFCDKIALINKGNIVLHDSIFNIKKSYPKNTIYVSFDTPKDVQAIESAAKEIAVSVEAKLPAGTSSYAFEFKLKPEYTKDHILKIFTGSDYDLNNFHIVEPSLEEVFVEKAGDSI